ncbi:MAG: DUF2442 domain-containing protein [Candidatus Rokubacteria bacterium]|nr:DUF2442 domain-containing protein [Candidatus Rokubacteria bacterium]
MIRVREATAGEGFCLVLRLTNGMTVERDLSDVLTGPIFEALRVDPALFRDVRVEGGTVVWPNGADICPDVLIWDGPPPHEDRTPAARVRLQQQATV